MTAPTDKRGKPMATVTPEQREWLLEGCVRRPAPHERDLYNPNAAERVAAFDEDTTASDWCADKLESVTAPTETPSLTTEQARDLATRWAFWQTGLKQCADNAEFDREMAKAPMLLADPEREQLFAWVRARMAADLERDPGLSRVDLATVVEGNLAETIPPGEPHPGLGAAWNLCKAAGWPS